VTVRLNRRTDAMSAEFIYLTLVRYIHHRQASVVRVTTSIR